MSVKETFAIGQEVWYVHLESVEKWLPCPDCCGKKYLTVILGDGSEVTIDCAGCQSGYEPSKGILRVYQYSPLVQLGRVSGIECDRWNKCNSVEYRIEGAYCYCLKDCDVFLDKSSAEARAIVKAQEEADAQMKRFYEREQPKRTWGWNATYHRKQLKEAQRQIQYHSAKLEAAKQHIKEEKSL